MLRLFRFSRFRGPGRERRLLLALVPVLALGTAVPAVVLATPGPAYAASSGGVTPVVGGNCNPIPTGAPAGNYYFVTAFTAYYDASGVQMGQISPPCGYTYFSGPQAGQSFYATPTLASQSPADTCQVVQEEYGGVAVQVNSQGTCLVQLTVPGISTVFDWYLVATNDPIAGGPGSVLFMNGAPPPGEPAVLPPMPPGAELDDLGCAVGPDYFTNLAPPAVAVLPDSSDQGYWIIYNDGQVSACGDAPTWYGQLTNPPAHPVVAAAETPGGTGYWMVTSNGQVFAFGSAQFYGDAANLQLAAPIVGMAADPATGGYWLVAPDGGLFAYNAPFLGNPYTQGLTGLGGPHPLAEPIVGMAATPNGQGYWMDAKDGGVFSFGDAQFQGNPYTQGLTGLGGPHPLAKPIVGMAPDPATGGYWLVAADGGVFSYNAPFLGSVPGQLGPGRSLHQPVVGMEAASDGSGYRVVASDGGIFDFGSCPYEGSPLQ